MSPRIAQLTFADGTKITLVRDHIMSLRKDGKGTEVRMADGSAWWVQEHVMIITRMLEWD